MDARDIIEAFDLAAAPSDTSRAKLLAAIVRYAKEKSDTDLQAAAQDAMPSANPFSPPDVWRSQYESGFEDFADEDCGVYLDDMRRYGTEYWQGMNDEERQNRLENPALGRSDGEKDATALNAA